MAFCSKRDQTKLAIRDFSCFCAFCIDEDYERCISLHHARIWKVHFIVPLNPRYIQSVVEGVNKEDDWEHGGNGDEIVQSFDIGNNFVVNVALGNEEDYEFYVVCCEKPLFEVNVDGLISDWGNTFELGSIVVGGYYYQRRGQGNQGDGVSYVNLLDQGTAYFYPHLVHASKFVMPLVHHRVVGNILVHHMFAKIEILINPLKILTNFECSFALNCCGKLWQKKESKLKNL